MSKQEEESCREPDFSRPSTSREGSPPSATPERPVPVSTPEPSPSPAPTPAHTRGFGKGVLCLQIVNNRMENTVKKKLLIERNIGGVTWQHSRLRYREFFSHQLELILDVKNVRKVSQLVATYDTGPYKAAQRKDVK